jgi:hypothetical protein
MVDVMMHIISTDKEWCYFEVKIVWTPLGGGI